MWEITVHMKYIMEAKNTLPLDGNLWDQII